jgi:hypothetical protein
MRESDLNHLASLHSLVTAVPVALRNRREKHDHACFRAQLGAAVSSMSTKDCQQHRCREELLERGGMFRYAEHHDV